jgi:hypothetical protein
VTGGTYSSGTTVFTNNTGGTFSITGFTNPFTGGTVDGLTATTISATTYFGLPTDVFVTGGTYSGGVTQFINNTGGTFSVSGFSTGTTFSGSVNTVPFYTGNTLSTSSPLLISGNNVGVGTSTTTYRLNVNSGNNRNGVGIGDYGLSRIMTLGYENATNPFSPSGAGTSFWIGNTGGPLILNSNTAIVGNSIINRSATINHTITVTGNTSLRAFTGTSGTISGSGQNILTVVGSGNSTTAPLFSVQGSNGELFSVTDSLTGSLFSVNDISGLPIIEVFSDNTILMGNYLAPSLNTTARISLTAGTNTIYSIPISAYTGAFVDYTLINTGSTSARAGNLMTIWTTGTTEFTEVSTNDIGSTTGVTFSTSLSGSNALIRASATTSGWVVKTIIRSI